mmetsp:Transcript_12490/g.17614  ORF Transcript_12490/g.17614 Transcript_12490/m.17614 type:complete len:94 (+) Transcript_12490:256-537(+)
MGNDMRELFYSSSQGRNTYWKKYEKAAHKPSGFYSKEFRELFEGMVELDASKRWTLDKVKNSDFMKKGKMYTDKEYYVIMRKYFEDMEHLELQ